MKDRTKDTIELGAGIALGVAVLAGALLAVGCAADGVDGVDGLQGVNGTPCDAVRADGCLTVDCPGSDLVTVCDGAPGFDGADGSDGTLGVDGSDGSSGADGAPGADGSDGAPGSDGSDGVAGTSCTVSTEADGVRIVCSDGTEAFIPFAETRPVNPCNADPCGLGLCSTSFDDAVWEYTPAVCDCPPDFGGTFCEIPNPCGATDCNAGTCSAERTAEGFAAPVCACPELASGTFCEIPLVWETVAVGIACDYDTPHREIRWTDTWQLYARTFVDAPGAELVSLDAFRVVFHWGSTSNICRTSASTIGGPLTKCAALYAPAFPNFDAAADSVQLDPSTVSQTAEGLGVDVACGWWHAPEGGGHTFGSGALRLTYRRLVTVSP